MALQTRPPPPLYLWWDQRKSNHGSVFSVESVALCCVSYLSLFHPLFFSSPQAGFCYPVRNAGTFYVMWRYRRWLSAAFYGGGRGGGVLSENIVQGVLLCVFSKRNHLCFFFKKGLFVCVSVTVLWRKKKCIFVFTCNLFFKMSMGYLSHDLMSLW